MAPCPTLPQYRAVVLAGIARGEITMEAQPGTDERSARWRRAERDVTPQVHWLIARSYAAYGPMPQGRWLPQAVRITTKGDTALKAHTAKS